MQLELFNENIIIELELNHDINNPTSFILSKNIQDNFHEYIRHAYCDFELLNNPEDLDIKISYKEGSTKIF